MGYSVIIPYQHSTERESLLYKCLESLLSSSNGGLEICVHETGPVPHLKLPSRYRYLFTKHPGPFHRAWSLNRGVKELATNDTLILMDGDLLVSQQWYLELLQCSKPSVGWGKLNCLNRSGSTAKVKTPSRGSAAGGITVINRQLFYDLSGIPEDFEGSWGGEDNAFWSKLVYLGYKFRSFNSEIIHLYHSNSTPRVMSIQKKALSMHYWNKDQWKAHIEATKDSWGLPVPAKIEDTEFISAKSKARLSIAMLSWIRPDKLIETLTSLREVITFPINLTLMVQGSETLTAAQQKTIQNLASYFHRRDVFFTKGNIGTGPARRHLFERSVRRFHAPYINFADDDTTFTKGSLEAAINLLDRDLSIGVVGIRYKPTVYRLDSSFHPTRLSAVPSLGAIEYVDSTGSASAIIRREVFSLCSVDPRYKLGYWDLDLFLQARELGWKVVNYQSFDSMKAINNWGGSKTYRAGRMNRAEINNSRKLFTEKWGIKG